MAANTFEPRAAGDYVVLLYHGVYADSVDVGPRNNSGKHLNLAEFRYQMEIVARNWNVVSMLDIARAHQGLHSLPRRAVAITFDDGFANVYDNAWPVLRMLGIPSTFYLATGFIGTGRVSWTDELEMMILDAPTKTIEVNINGRQEHFRLGDTESRVASLARMKRLCKRLSFEHVRGVLQQVEAELGVHAVPSHPLYEMLDWDRVREMTADGVFDFGAHTVDHIPLSRIPHDEMTAQISGSLTKVSHELGVNTRLFSYPEGQMDDFDERSVRSLKSLGVELCPTAVAGVNNVSRTDPFYIHRCIVTFPGSPFILA